MDKLQPQTVYVPVASISSHEVNHKLNGALKPIHGVYPLTGKELAEVIKQAMWAAVNEQPIEQFLKSKGIEI